MAGYIKDKDTGGQKMDAVEYFKAYARMCDSFDSKDNVTGKPCVGCPLDDIGRGCHMNDLTNNAEECVAAVEKWAKEHPVKTRQSEFLKQYPEAEIGDDGLPGVDPCQLYKEIANVEIYDGYCNKYGCTDCRRDFWLAETKDGEA
jgi:hypothetical protein